MLKRLSTKCFRQHLEKEWVFGSGLVVIRGANEAGKSNLLAALLYALGGVKALSAPLSDVVTWGHDERELKVEAELEIEGVSYVFARSAAGAECNFTRGGRAEKVVGQSEVTRFACELMGAPNPHTLTRLMLARQNAIRGALEEGAAKITEQIEALANFDFFDRVFKKIEEHWVTGPVKALETRCAELGEQLRLLQDEAPDTSALDAQIARLSAEREQLATTLQEQAEPAYNAANTAFQTINEQLRLHRALQQAAQAAQERSADLQRQLRQAMQQAGVQVDRARLEAAGQELAHALEAARRQAAYRQLQQAMAAYPANFWEGDLDSFKAEVARLQAQARGLAAELGRLTGDIRVKQAQIVTGSVCGYCQQDFSQFPEIAAKNAQLRDEIAQLERQAQQIRTEQTWLEKGQQALAAIERVEGQFRSLQTVPDWVVRNLNYVPCRLEWKGPPPQDSLADPDALREEIRQLSSRAEAQHKAQLQVDVLAPQAAQAKVAEEAALREAAAAPELVLADAYTALADAQEALDKVKAALRQNKVALDEAEQSRQKMVALYEATSRQREQVERQRAQVCEDLKQQAFHNGIVKKVREARPQIADRLWNRILEAVSVIVTQTRGQPSVVTKGGDGFRLNGRDVGDYSGSALDLVGLAIRTVLVQTFLPHVQVLVLDEATAACDDDRTTAMIGYLAASGFDQVLLITHEEISETFANQVVQL